MILEHFHRRGYPLKLLKTSWEKAKNLNREALVKPKQIANTPTQNSSFQMGTDCNPCPLSRQTRPDDQSNQQPDDHRNQQPRGNQAGT